MATSLDTGESVVYRVDGEGVIVFVNDEWSRFAAANDAPELSSPGSVLGKRLDSFIAGLETKELCSLLARHARATGATVTVPFRCDGPTVRRLMELSIAPLPDGETEYRGRVLRREETDYLPLLDRQRPRSDEFLHVCSWCRSVRVGEKWLDVGTAVRRLRLFETERIPQISHGICRECRSRIESEWSLDGSPFPGS